MFQALGPVVFNGYRPLERQLYRIRELRTSQCLMNSARGRNPVARFAKYSERRALYVSDDDKHGAVRYNGKKIRSPGKPDRDLQSIIWTPVPDRHAFMARASLFARFV